MKVRFTWLLVFGSYRRHSPRLPKSSVCHPRCSVWKCTSVIEQSIRMGGTAPTTNCVRLASELPRIAQGRCQHDVSQQNLRPSGGLPSSAMADLESSDSCLVDTNVSRSTSPSFCIRRHCVRGSFFSLIMSHRRQVGSCSIIEVKYRHPTQPRCAAKPLQLPKNSS